MKQFFKMFFASLLAVIIAGVIVFGLVLGLTISAVKNLGNTNRPVALKNNAVLVLKLDKNLHEQGETNSFAAFNDASSYDAGLFDLQQSLKEAAEDDNVKAVLLQLKGNHNGWATLQALRASLVAFKKSGKPVYAYGEGITQKDYYVASAADKVYLNPIGDFELRGLAAQIPFFKGTLDKLGVEPEIFYAGKFKSATEPFRLKEMSEPNRVQITALLNDIWGDFLSAAAEKAGQSPEGIQALVQSGAIRFGRDAAAQKLVDGLKYWDEVEAEIRQDLKLEQDDKIPYQDIDAYANKIRRKPLGSGDRIAVLFAEGDIIDGRGDDYQIASEDIVKTIRKIKENKKVKAVVLRINSPGGSALASEVILRELELLKKEKPLVVSMGDLAASGGYFISCAADSVFASQATLTGSIGVFGMMFNLSPMLDQKLGVTFDGVKTGPYADFPSATRPMTADEKARMQQQVDTIYAIFKNHVIAARKLSPALVDSIAQGRVWSGRQAAGIGLVHAFGDLNRAIQSAASLAKIEDYAVQTYPEPVDKFQSILRRFSGEPMTALAVQQALEEMAGPDFKAMQRLQWLRQMNGKSMMLLPEVLVIE